MPAWLDEPRAAGIVGMLTLRGRGILLGISAVRSDDGSVIAVSICAPELGAYAAMGCESDEEAMQRLDDLDDLMRESMTPVSLTQQVEA